MFLVPKFIFSLYFIVFSTILHTKKKESNFHYFKDCVQSALLGFQTEMQEAAIHITKERIAGLIFCFNFCLVKSDSHVLLLKCSAACMGQLWKVCIAFSFYIHAWNIVIKVHLSLST